MSKVGTRYSRAFSIPYASASGATNADAPDADAFATTTVEASCSKDVGAITALPSAVSASILLPPFTADTSASGATDADVPCATNVNAATSIAPFL